MRWSDIEKIVGHLEITYLDEEIPDEDHLDYLKEMVFSLSEFEEHEIEADREQLKRIMEHWMEIREQK